MVLIGTLAGVVIGFVCGVLTAAGYLRQPDTGINGATMADCPRCRIKLSALCTKCRARNLAAKP